MKEKTAWIFLNCRSLHKTISMRKCPNSETIKHKSIIFRWGYKTKVTVSNKPIPYSFLFADRRFSSVISWIPLSLDVSRRAKACCCWGCVCSEWKLGHSASSCATERMDINDRTLGLGTSRFGLYRHSHS